MHQCLIFDSDTPGARLIGIEYVIPEETFVTLPEEEKKYWHSHKFGMSPVTQAVELAAKANSLHGRGGKWDVAAGNEAARSKYVNRSNHRFIANPHLDAVADTAEIPAMTELQTTYGKTTHTWYAPHLPRLINIHS